jgi:hypothetical protein
MVAALQAVVVVMVLGAAPAGEAAQTTAALHRRGRVGGRHQWVYENLAAFRYNPIGVVNLFRTGYRWRMYSSMGALFADNFLDLKVHTYLNPAYGLVGPMVEIQPFSALRLGVNYNFYGTFGALGILQSFATPTADHSPAALADGTRRDQHYATAGQQLNLSAQLQMALGPVAVQDVLLFQWVDLRLREGHTVFYDQTLDILQPDRGWVTTNDASLLYLSAVGLLAGARYTVTHPFYRPDMYLPGEEPKNINGPTHRLGPALYYRFFSRPAARWNEPTLVLLCQWWLQHRYRAGQETHAGIPYLALAFTFRGELSR